MKKNLLRQKDNAQESNIFFSKDLSQFLNSIGTKIEEDDNDNSMLKVAGGITKVPFEFTIPDML